VTAKASGRQLSSGAHDADIEVMRTAILLAALLAPAAASASSTSRIGVSAVVVPSVRFSQEVGAPVRKIGAAGGAFYVLPLKGSATGHGGGAPSISVEGAEALLRQSRSADESTVEGDLRVFVPEGSEGRVVVTVLADGAAPALRRKR
jgi:hypothetical protein